MPKFYGGTGCTSLFSSTILQGFFALYKGMSAPLVGVVPIFAINFLGYANGKSICYWATGKNELRYLSYSISAISIFLAVSSYSYTSHKNKWNS